MLRPGVFSMQDFHLFRQLQFHKCVIDLQIPCRWAPDSGFGYGQPLFNFYTQVPYVLGEAFHLLGFQIIDSVKILFILTLLGSGITMYLLANQIWKDKSAAVLSSVLYMYAPYRALDVWVRAALPEATAFILFPLIVFFANSFIEKKNVKTLIFFSVSIALLIVTHNLSFLMFAPFLGLWLAYKIVKERKYNTISYFATSLVFSLLLSAFYLLPVIFEQRFIDLSKTTQGYFDFRGHFAGLNQMLFSRFWGYGASLFGPNDDLGLSAGQIQWILPTLASVCLLVLRNKDAKTALIFLSLGWLSLFMAHNKSAPIWEALPPLSYLQFPWRWLAIGAFGFALAGGGSVLLFKHKAAVIVAGLLIAVTIATNMEFFREDIWYNITDKEQFSGKRWEEQQASAINDYWPKHAKEVPTAPAPKSVILSGMANGEELIKKTNKAVYKVNLQEQSEIQFPIVFFPDWTANIRDKSIETYPSGDLGLVTTKLEAGEHEVNLRFKNTQIRTLGNILSLLSVLLLGLFIYIPKMHKRHA